MATSFVVFQKSVKLQGQTLAKVGMPPDILDIKGPDAPTKADVVANIADRGRRHLVMDGFLRI